MLFPLNDINIFTHSIRILLSSNEDFVIFRNMQDNKIHFLSIQKNNNSKETFVIAPFNPDDKPLYLNVCMHTQGDIKHICNFIHKNYSHLNFEKTLNEQTNNKEPLSQEKINSFCKTANEKAYKDYCSAFSKFKQELVKENFAKLVLSRPYFCPLKKDLSHSFLDLCKTYPNAFCYMAKVGSKGIFMGASPEILASVADNELKTMSLAGTMAKSLNNHYEWSSKNIKEQQLVTDFIISRIKPYAKSISAAGPVTHDAGPVVHLLTQITAVLNDGIDKHSAAASLHPTPAVCGLPKNAALKFIVKNEGYKRNYYSGYIGLISPNNLQLFVNLRCMFFNGQFAVLYAGGGLLKSSDLEDEWQETENKLKTLRDLI